MCGDRERGGHLSFTQPGSQRLSTKADEGLFRAVSVHAQHASPVEQTPNDARQKRRIALADLARLLALGNDLFHQSEIPAAADLRGAGFEQYGDHHLELGATFVRKTGIGERHGIHLRGEALSGVVSWRSAPHR